jgi:hypothetical protein
MDRVGRTFLSDAFVFLASPEAKAISTNQTKINSLGQEYPSHTVGATASSPVQPL